MVDIEKLEQELENANSVEAVQEILKNNAVEMSADEIRKMMEEVAPHGELSVDDLDEVAGGSIVPWGRYGLGHKIAKWIISKFM